MSTFIICGSGDSEWLEERRRRVTASELSIWIGTAPSFYSETRETLLARKLSGGEADFNDKSLRRLAHGREREANALRMTGEMFGYPTAGYSYLVGNERWPFLAATMDGLMFPWLGRQPRFELTSQVGHMAEIANTIAGLGQPILVEIKVSDSGHRYKDKDGPHAGRKAWIDYSPTYHAEQVQTGLWMAGLDHALLAGCLGGDELICWYHQRNAEWAEVLDRANEEAGQALAPLWGR